MFENFSRLSQDIINQVSAPKSEAEAEAERARTKARKLIGEKMVMIAYKEGRHRVSMYRTLWPHHSAQSWTPASNAQHSAISYTYLASNAHPVHDALAPALGSSIVHSIPLPLMYQHHGATPPPGSSAIRLLQRQRAHHPAIRYLVLCVAQCLIQLRSQACVSPCHASSFNIPPVLVSGPHTLAHSATPRAYSALCIVKPQLVCPHAPPVPRNLGASALLYFHTWDAVPGRHLDSRL